MGLDDLGSATPIELLAWAFAGDSDPCAAILQAAAEGASVLSQGLLHEASAACATTMRPEEVQGTLFRIECHVRAAAELHHRQRRALLAAGGAL